MVCGFGGHFFLRKVAKFASLENKYPAVGRTVLKRCSAVLKMTLIGGGLAVVAANDHSLVDENFGSKITGSQDFESSQLALAGLLLRPAVSRKLRTSPRQIAWFGFFSLACFCRPSLKAIFKHRVPEFKKMFKNSFSLNQIF